MMDLQLKLKTNSLPVLKAGSGAASTTTETFMLPGYGIVTEAQDGETYMVPGYGIMTNRST